MMAVYSVAPLGRDNPVALIAALVSANETPEPDTIQLAPGTYDLSSFSSMQSLTIASNITIVGTSPDAVKIIPARGVRPIHVTDQGTLDLRDVGIAATYSSMGAAVLNEGSASLTNVGITGTIQDGPHDEWGDVFTLIVNRGDLSIDRSALIGSVSNGVTNLRNGRLSVTDSIIAGNAGAGIVNVDIARPGDRSDPAPMSATVTGSILFGNTHGIYGSAPLNISATTITDNDSVIGGAGVQFGGASDDLTVGPNNQIVGNRSEFGGNDLVNTKAFFEQGRIQLVDGVRASDTFGDLATAQANVSEITVSIAIDGVLDRDDLIGIFTPTFVRDDGQTSVIGVTDRPANLFWDQSSDQFVVALSGQVPSDRIVADSLRDFQFGGDLVDFPYKPVVSGNDRLTLDRIQLPDWYTIGERNLWGQLRPTRVTSQHGFSSGEIYLRSFDYAPPAAFSGTDILTITSLNEAGQEKSVDVTIEVAPADIRLDIIAVEQPELIRVEVNAAGTLYVNSFAFAIEYDPTVVRPQVVSFGDDFPTLQSVSDATRGLISFSAIQRLDGVIPNADLATVRFERISDGAAGIQILRETDWKLNASGFDLGPGAVNVEYASFESSDTNRDGKVSAADALSVINGLAREGNKPKTLDVNGDGKVSAVDALMVINRLGRTPSAEEPELFAPQRHSIFADSVIANWQSDDEEDTDSFIANLF